MPASQNGGNFGCHLGFRGDRNKISDGHTWIIVYPACSRNMGNYIRSGAIVHVAEGWMEYIINTVIETCVVYTDMEKKPFLLITIQWL